MKLRIYTDGACSGNPGPGGWASLLMLPEHNQMISGNEKDTTSNRMELKAAIEALKLALSLDYDKIEVHSDSAYVVNAVSKGWLKKWKNNGWLTVQGKEVKNQDLWKKLLVSLKQAEVRLIKVKGHSDNVWNNMCDEQAVKEVAKIKRLLA